MNNRQEVDFTLFEIAFVLAALGFLLAGVLKSQEWNAGNRSRDCSGPVRVIDSHHSVRPALFLLEPVCGQSAARPRLPLQ